MHHKAHGHFNDCHEGHVDKCCLFIPIAVGTHIIGVLTFVKFVLMALGTFSLLSYIDDYFVSFCINLAATLFVAYPALRYLQLLFKRNQDHKDHFEKAYRFYAYVISTLIAIWVVLCEILLVVAIFGSPDLLYKLGVSAA